MKYDADEFRTLAQKHRPCHGENCRVGDVLSKALLSAVDEVERLQEALRSIRDFWHAPECESLAPVYECACYKKSQAEIAEEALG